MAEPTGKQLLDAARDGKITEVVRLIEAGLDKDFQNELGVTALMRACGSQNDEVVDYLLAVGANVNLTTNWHSTALFWCCNPVCERIVEKLLVHAIDPYVVDAQNKTAIDYIRDPTMREEMQTKIETFQSVLK